MTWLLGLYPREWRERYGDEIAEVIASQPLSPQLIVDLLGGAIDAHWKPQAFARRIEKSTPNQGDTDMVYRLKSRDVDVEMNPREVKITTGLTLLAGVVATAGLMLFEGQMGRAVGLSIFPAVLAAPSQWIYLRGHSKAARIVLGVAPLVICGVIGVVAGLIVSD